MIDHKEILNGFMSEMQHYIRHNETKTDWNFNSNCGLCANLTNYTVRFTYSGYHRHEVRLLLRESIIKAGFNHAVFPFEAALYNDPDERYTLEAASNLLYCNPLRLSFIENWKPL